MLRILLLRMARFIHISLLFLAFCSPAFAAKSVCLNDEDAREQVQANKLITVDKALIAARAKTKGDLISAHLCQVPDGFMYRIAIINHEGRVVKLLIDAHSGQIVE